MSGQTYWAADGVSGSEVDPAILGGTQAYLRDRALGLEGTDQGRHSWELFFARYDPLVEFLTAVYLRRPHDRLDCRQEVWLHIFRKLPTFQFDRQRGEFRCWLFILIRNRVLDFARHMAHEHQRECALPGDLPARGAPSPWWVCLHHECQCCLHESLDELERHVSPLNRRLLHLRYRRQLTVREAAGRLQLTPRQVAGRLVRLRRRLLHDVRCRANGQRWR